MNQRERLLASIVGGMILIMLGYFIWSSVTEVSRNRHNRLNALQQQLDQQQTTLDAASRATRELRKLNERSLPKDPEQANSMYSEWLLDLVDRVGFRNPSVRTADRRIRREYFDRLRFDVEADATLDQLADFLAKFYLSGDLHKIRNMTLNPIPDSRHIDLLITIETVILPNSQRKSVGDIQSDDVDALAVEVSRDLLRNRAMLFPANIAPLVDPISDKRIVQGRRWRYEVRATDPDPWDELFFDLKSELPDGFSIEQRANDRAVLTWVPTELGEFEVELLVTDTGNPPMESTRKFRLSVVEPPPPTESAKTDRVVGFDHATQTFLVACVSNQDGYRAWFDVRTQGKIIKLGVGDAIRIGSIRGELSAISRRHAEILTDRGRLHVPIGRRLSEATLEEVPRQADARSDSISIVPGP